MSSLHTPEKLDLLTAGLSAAFGQPVRFSDDVEAKGLLAEKAIGLARVDTRRDPVLSLDRSNVQGRRQLVPLRSQKSDSDVVCHGESCCPNRNEDPLTRLSASASPVLSQRFNSEAVIKKREKQHLKGRRRFSWFWRGFPVEIVYKETERIKIKIKTLDSTVEELKEQILTELEIPVEEQTLYLHGSELQNGDVLRDLDVESGSCFHLSLTGCRPRNNFSLTQGAGEEVPIDVFSDYSPHDTQSKKLQIDSVSVPERPRSPSADILDLQAPRTYSI